MNLNQDADIALFQAEVRDFLRANLTDDLRRSGLTSLGICSDYAPGMVWQKILHAKGWAAPHWPKEFGGCGWNDMQRYVFSSECAMENAPKLAPMGLGMIGPTLIVCGSETQKEYYLPRILSGEDFWCQGYSEPGSGSDLASLSCRAIRDGDDYVINGTKIWTTMAHNANMMFCLVRTNTEVKPQQGISFILIDMTLPGISVRPIITLAGEHEVNQVFFEDVRVPASQLVGAENDGWTVAKTLLTFERGGAYAARLREKHARLAQLISPLQDYDLNQRLTDLHVRLDALEANEFRVQSQLSQGHATGPASSQLKIMGTELQQDLDMLGVEALGVDALPWAPEARLDGRLHNQAAPDFALMGMADYLSNRAASVYGGSNEVQRNIIAKAALGL